MSAVAVDESCDGPETPIVGLRYAPDAVDSNERSWEFDFRYSIFFPPGERLAVPRLICTYVYDFQITEKMVRK